MAWPPGGNPLAGNPFLTRQDAQRAVADLITPLLSAFSPGKARVHLGSSGATFDTAAAHLEGLARPLWGLAPLLAGGGTCDGIDAFLTGLSNGADPDHPEYWGPVTDRDQRMVESAAIGFALCLAPETFWDGLTPRGRDCLGAWLCGSLEHAPPDNNWHFFHVMVSLGLTRVGIAHDLSIISRDLDAIESYDLGEGWYRDGLDRRCDHYIPFAMHFYGLIYAAYGPDTDVARRDRFRDRARLFAPKLSHWFASDGAALPYGRSLTYRFAHAGFWAALALADEEALPWSEIRGYWARNLRYWSRQDIADRSGVLSIGYGYAQLSMAERYNSPGSPYWALKAFAPLALPAEHPFWTTEEAPFEHRAGIVTLPQPGMVKWEDAGDITVLSGGQHPSNIGRSAEKYSKFAYSTRYAFSVEAEARSFEAGPFDNMLAFSEDGEVAHVRSRESMARIGEGWLYSAWSPMPEVEVETWLIARPPWHLRIHHVVTKRTVMTREGGFAIGRLDADPPIPTGSMPTSGTAESATACISTARDRSFIAHTAAPLGSPVARQARMFGPTPNTNLICPRTWVPQLTADLPPGDWGLACWVTAGPACGPAPDTRARGDVPDRAELLRLRDAGDPVGVWLLDPKPG